MVFVTTDALAAEHGREPTTLGYHLFGKPDFFLGLWLTDNEFANLFGIIQLVRNDLVEIDVVPRIPKGRRERGGG